MISYDLFIIYITTRYLFLLLVIRSAEAVAYAGLFNEGEESLEIIKYNFFFSSLIILVV